MPTQNYRKILSPLLIGQKKNSRDPEALLAAWSVSTLDADMLPCKGFDVDIDGSIRWERVELEAAMCASKLARGMKDVRDMLAFEADNAAEACSNECSKWWG